ncbi:MAG: Clostridium protein, partial [Bacteroidota bacterium]
MNLYGWDLLFATKLTSINEKFQKNSAYLSSSFNFESTDSFFKTKVTISGKFGQWTLAGKNSNSLINVTIAVNGLSLSGLSADNISNANISVTLGLNLNFISDKSNANKKNLQFNYSGDGGGNNNNISIIKI